MSEEIIVYDGKIPFRALYFSHGIFWILIFGWNFGLIAALWKSLSHKIRITSQRIIFVKGLFTQSEVEVDYYRIKDSQSKQGIFGRIFAVGEIYFWSDTSTYPYFSFRFIEPKKYREHIRGFIRDEKQRMKVIT